MLHYIILAYLAQVDVRFGVPVGVPPASTKMSLQVTKLRHKDGKDLIKAF